MLTKILKGIDRIAIFSTGTIVGFCIAQFAMDPGKFHGAATGLVVAAVGMSVTMFVDYLISPGQIFGFWQKVLNWMNSPKNLLFVLYKPLGGCLYCMNVWSTFVIFLVSRSWHDLSFWYLIGVLPASHILLAITEKRVNS
jgi:hypothetical protein